MSASTEKKNRQAAREAGLDKKANALLEEEKKNLKSKRRWTLGTIAVIVLIAAILLLDSGILYKSTAYTVGDKAYSAAETNYYYATQYHNFSNQYGNYASIFGLDVSTGIQGLDKQECSMNGATWKDYFLDEAKTSMQQIKALTDYASENGIALTQEDLDAIEANFADLDSYAKLQGYANGDSLISANYGQGVNLALMRKTMTDATLANKASQEKLESFQYDESTLKEHYKSFDGSYDLFDYAYYLVEGESTETTGADGNVSSEVSDAALAAAMDKASEIKAAYEKGEGDDFVARLESAVGEAVTHQEASLGSGLSVASEWLMDSSRKQGDCFIEANSASTGYNVVVFISRDSDNNNYKTASVRHILIKAEAAEDGSFTDEAKAAAKARAEEILSQFNSGDKTEESFAALANEFSEDTGSNTNGGLYENIAKGQMVEEFEAFCFETHKKGDTAIVFGENGGYAGYHVMYFVENGPLYCDYLAEQDLREADYSAWFEELLASYPVSEGFGIRFVGK